MGVSRRLVYTSRLDVTRTVIHELVSVKRRGESLECVTTTGLEFRVDAKGNVLLQCGGNEQRTVPPEPWEVRRRHPVGDGPIRCGIGGVVD